MGLSKLDKLKREEKAALEIDLFVVTGEHSVFRFREPRAADLFPNPELLKEIKIAFPEFPELMIDRVCIIGKTYLPDDSDEEINPIRSFGNLARSHREAFLYIFTRFEMYFMQGDVEEKVIEAKNASTE